MQPQYNFYPYGQQQPPPPPLPPPAASYQQTYPPQTYYAHSQPYPPPQYYTYSAPPPQYHHYQPSPPLPQYYHPHTPAVAQQTQAPQYASRTTNPIPTVKHFCEPCDKEFSSMGAYSTHMKSHEKCPDPNCNFTASKRVVSTHYDLTHGIYGGHGYKVIDVEGQSFKVLMGTDPLEVEQWRNDRRKKFPTAATVALKEQTREKYLEQGGIDKNKKRKVDQLTTSAESSLSQLAAYGSDEEPVESATPKKKKVCSYFLKGKCRHGKRCHYLHERPVDENGNPILVTGPEQKEKREKKEKKGGLHLPKPLVGGKEGSLFRKLIEELVHEDENLILQCFRYLVQENFFRPEESNNCTDDSL